MSVRPKKKQQKSIGRLFPSSKAYMSAELRETYFDELFAEDSILTNRLRSVKDQIDDPEEERKERFKAGLKACRVVRKYESEASELYRLRFVCVDTYEKVEIEGTPEHPFWVAAPCGPDGKGRWVPIKNLEIGYKCISGDGSYMQLVEKEHIKLDKPIKVYNLEVEGGHTYFVGKDGKGVLVHNQCGGAEQYSDQFEKMLEKAKADYNGRLRYLIRNMPYSYSTLGPVCDSMIWQNNYDNDGILRFYKARLDTMERVLQVASSLSPENKNHLFHAVITLYNVNAYAWWINTSGWELNCHTWTEKARDSINALSLPYDKGFDIGYTTYEVVPGTENQRGRDLKGWKDHSFVTITIKPTSKTPATTFYFDNGGLGIPWFNGKAYSYGGIFLEIPPWLQYHIPQGSND